MSHVAVLVLGIWNTKKWRADPSFGDSSLFHPTSPPIHSFPLLSTCCLILTVLIFSLSLWEQSVLDSVNVSCEKRCRKGENYHMSLFFAFHFGSKVSWILFTFHVRKDVNKERITTCHSSLHFTSGHNHCRSISHNHSDHPRVILSRSISTRSLDSQVWRSSTCHFESINVNNKPNMIRARYLGLFHFVDHDGWDQTFLSCFWHRPTSDPLQCCKRFLPPCMWGKTFLLLWFEQC